ncbi:MAG: hypothetical protein AB1611_08255 [bacterium]
MNKRQLILLSIGSLLLVLAAAMLICLVNHRSNLSEEQIQRRMNILHGSAAVPVAPNRSEIMAEVEGVEKGDFPIVHLTLQIIESRDISEFNNLLEPGRTIEASPQYVYEYRAGARQIVLTDPQNIRNFQAYYLFPKDRFRAMAWAKGGPGNLNWSITDITRIAGQEPVFGPVVSPSPAPIAPNKSRITGSVLKVERKDYPQVELTLRVMESRDIGDFYNFLGPGVTITARPEYVYEKDTFVPTEPRNSRNLLAYYLVTGDIIEAEASLYPGNGRLTWVISDLERVPQESEVENNGSR